MHETLEGRHTRGSTNIRLCHPLKIIEWLLLCEIYFTRRSSQCHVILQHTLFFSILHQCPMCLLGQI